MFQALPHGARLLPVSNCCINGVLNGGFSCLEETGSVLRNQLLKQSFLSLLV